MPRTDPLPRPYRQPHRGSHSLLLWGAPVICPHTRNAPSPLSTIETGPMTASVIPPSHCRDSALRHGHLGSSASPLRAHNPAARRRGKATRPETPQLIALHQMAGHHRQSCGALSPKVRRASSAARPCLTSVGKGHKRAGQGISGHRCRDARARQAPTRRRTIRGTGTPDSRPSQARGSPARQCRGSDQALV